MSEITLERALNFMFEDLPVNMKMPTRFIDYQTACQLVINKLDDLASEGIITFSQASVTKHYLPFCELEDLLIFILGYKGFITESFTS